MQDLASEFSKIFRGWYLRILTAGGGDPLPHRTTSRAFGRARSASFPVLGPKPWYPSTFQPWLRSCKVRTVPHLGQSQANCCALNTVLNSDMLLTSTRLRKSEPNFKHCGKTGA